MGWKDVSDEDLADLISSSAEVDAGLNEFMSKEIVRYWRSVSPVLKQQSKSHTKGAYKASVMVKRRSRVRISLI